MKQTQLQPVLHSRGFTLVELVVVILILGILAINVGSRFFTKSAFSDRKVADELIEAIRYTQHLAMSRGGNESFQIEFSTTSYSVQDSSGIVVTNPNRTDEYDVTIPNDTSLTASTSIISFNGLGQPTPNADTTINVGSSFTITVEQETGYAHY